MASTYTPLGVELQATGENAGTWGTKTNTNLQIIEQISGGYTTQAVSDSGDTTLSVSDGATGATLSHRVIEFTGSLTASRNVTIPNDVVQLSGVSAEFSLGSSIGLGGAIVQPSSLSITPSVGSLTVEEGLGLTGQSFSASVGSLSINDMTIGFTGQLSTFNIGSVDIFAYGDVDTGSNTSYSNVSTGSNDSYSDVATGSNTSYSDAA